MKTFRYQAKDPAGRDSEGKVQAATREDAEAQLAWQDLIVLALEEEDSAAPAAPAGWSPSSRVPLDSLVAFLYEMAVLAEAGVPLPQALELFLSACPPGQLAADLREVLKEVRAGSPLSEALRRRPRTFPPLCSALLRSGEASGTMPRVFLQLSAHFENLGNLRERLVSSLTYPAVVALTAAALMAGLVFFVAPRFARIYEQLGLPLPFFTRAFLEIGDYSTLLLALAVALAGLGGAALLNLRARPDGSLILDRWKLRVPWLGPILGKVALGGFCKTLAMLYEGGLRLPEAVELAAEAAGNQVLVGALDGLREGLYQGQPLSQAAGSSGLFSEHDLGMIRIGETSGRLGPMLRRMGELLEGQADTRVRRLLGLLEPLLICAVAVFVGGTVLAMAAPILNLPTLLQ